MGSIGAVNNELLRDGVRLNNDVLHENFLVTNLKGFPSLSLVPREFDLLGGLALLSDDNNGSMVSNFVNEDSRLY